MENFSQFESVISAINKKLNHKSGKINNPPITKTNNNNINSEITNNSSINEQQNNDNKDNESYKTPTGGNAKKSGSIKTDRGDKTILDFCECDATGISFCDVRELILLKQCRICPGCKNKWKSKFSSLLSFQLSPAFSYLSFSYLSLPYSSPFTCALS